MILKYCLKYLVSDDISKVALCGKDIQSRHRKFILLEYAANDWWKAVLQQGSSGCPAGIEEQAMDFLSHKEKATSWFHIVVKSTTAKITGLHGSLRDSAACPRVLAPGLCVSR